MQQRHPMQNPSLTPYGFVFPDRQKRLECLPPENMCWVNEEKIIARVWDRYNRSNAPRPLPVQTILHEILPSQASANRISDGDFRHDGLPYLARDILVLSSTIQWLGTNCGRCFLETDISRDSIPGFHPEREFLIKLAKEMKRMDMVAFFTHVCSPRCKTIRSIYGNGCYHNSREVSARDRAVVDGLMRWLGRNAGRAFIAEFTARKKSAWESANKRRREEMVAKGWLKAAALL